MAGFPKIPLGNWTEVFVNLIFRYFRSDLRALSHIIDTFIAAFAGLMQDFLPFWLVILLMGLVAWKVSGKGLALFTVVGLALVSDLGYWQATMSTFVLVATATVLAVIVGIPLGIWAALNRRVESIIRPVLDFMQTMPSFVYLIPAVMLLGLGRVPGVLATLIFAVPPVIRLTTLGIQQVPGELVEVGESFGSTPGQLLWKVQFPMALPTIMAGINQSVMLALSMIVIAAMIGAGGLGAEVLRGIQRLDIGVGFESGLSVVILAITIDRITQGLGARRFQ